MERQIFLHVGFPKTGTSFLQQRVFPHVSDVNVLIKPREMLDICFQDPLSYDAQEMRSRLEPLLRPGRNLITFERLVGDFFVYRLLNSELIANRLKELFPEARILFTIRNHYDFVCSMYKQYVRSGGTKTLRQFARFENGAFHTDYRPWVYENGINIRTLSYARILSCYETRFGKDSITVIPFETLVADPHAFVRECLSWVGSPSIPDIDFSVINEGMGTRRLNIARFCNRFLRSAFGEGPVIPNVGIPWQQQRIDSVGMFHLLQSRLLRLLMPIRRLEDAEMRTALRKQFADENRELSKRYALRLDERFPGTYF